MKKIFITSEDYQLLAAIFQNLSCEVFVFGSRIKGTQQPFSDLDICLKSNNPIDIATLKEALTESDLPFTVDVVDYQNISEAFKTIIDHEGVPFSQTYPAHS